MSWFFKHLAIVRPIILYKTSRRMPMGLTPGFLSEGFSHALYSSVSSGFSSSVDNFFGNFSHCF